MRILALNIGNSTAFAGVYSGSRRTALFRVPVARIRTAEGIERHLLRKIRGRIDLAAMASVVPSMTGPILKRFRNLGIEARLLHPKAAHGLSIAYKRPALLGSDRLSAALGAFALWPGRNIVVVDMGTATTLTAIDGHRGIRGGAILPGIGLWSEALSTGTAQLPAVAARKPTSVLGRSPSEAIASGIYYGHLGAVRELLSRIRARAFDGKKAIIVGTGGGAQLYSREGLFDRIEPDLVLRGLVQFAQNGLVH